MYGYLYPNYAHKIVHKNMIWGRWHTKRTKQSVNTRIIRYAEVPYCDRKLIIISRFVACCWWVSAVVAVRYALHAVDALIHLSDAFFSDAFISDARHHPLSFGALFLLPFSDFPSCHRPGEFDILLPRRYHCGRGKIYMLVTKPRNLHYRYCPLQYWYGNFSLSFLVM